MATSVVPASARATRRGLFLPIRLDPRRGQKGTSILLPGVGMMEPSELLEILAYVNEKHGRDYTLADIEQQVEARLKGTYGKRPSIYYDARQGWILDGKPQR